MKQLEEDIKNKRYKKIYVLTGPQSYNRKRYEKALIGVFLPNDDEINLTRYFGKKIELKEVIELADTMPFMAERRVIVLENTGLFEKACDELADYIPNIPDSCCMIFSEEKVDSRLRQTKAVKTHGCIAEFSNLTEADMRDFVMKKLAREHRPITEKALDLFVKRCSDDLWQVTGDLEKLISYTFGKDGIRVEDVEAVIPAPAEDKIFGMIDAILSGNVKQTLIYYRDLLALRSEPMVILGLIRDQYRLMLHAKQLNDEHVGIPEMAKMLKMRDARVKMALSAARRIKQSDLVSGITMCAQTDERIKTGLVDQRVGVETLIIELCRIH